MLLVSEKPNAENLLRSAAKLGIQLKTCLWNVALYMATCVCPGGRECIRRFAYNRPGLVAEAVPGAVRTTLEKWDRGTVAWMGLFPKRAKVTLQANQSRRF